MRWEEFCKPKIEGGMGFKDLAMFNDALLAKQASQLLHNKDSLFYRALKTRFFLNCSIFEVKEGTSRSYIWKSILKGSVVLKKGVYWRVGIGEDILLSNSWLSSRDKPRLQSPLSEELSTAHVVDLIGQPTK